MFSQFWGLFQCTAGHKFCNPPQTQIFRPIEEKNKMLNQKWKEHKFFLRVSTLYYVSLLWRFSYLIVFKILQVVMPHFFYPLSKSRAQLYKYFTVARICWRFVITMPTKAEKKKIDKTNSRKGQIIAKLGLTYHYTETGIKNKYFYLCNDSLDHGWINTAYFVSLWLKEI